MNQSLSDSKIVESFISKSKKTSVLHFYKNKFVFQLESDHTPREIYFKEIDLILISSFFSKSFFLVCFILTLILVNIFFYYYTADGQLANIFTSVLILLSVIVNYWEGHHRLVQVKKGALTIDVFHSYNKNEVNKAFKLLNNKL